MQSRCRNALSDIINTFRYNDHPRSQFWERVSPLKFREVGRHAKADIDIRFETVV